MMVISVDEKRHLERLVDKVVEIRYSLDVIVLEISARLDVGIDVAVDAVNESDQVQDLLDKFGIEVSTCVATQWSGIQRSCNTKEDYLELQEDEDEWQDI